ncbi:hypothetical protein [Hymenobacter negativus]|uniref:Uncharacterized protein n=1 Tax=Hymenobacter negativus TaxID=2795026 RepID=A0ABS3QNW9_9BACT|nr:hypothetical protein [Hymenobacter negativus]MBO2012802.1 hypothetical protein [Hymenobacter negativus]
MRSLLLVLFGCWGSIATLRAQAVVSMDSSMFRCVVRTSQTDYYYREPIAFDVQLINDFKQPVLIVDGEVSSGMWSYFPEPELQVYRLRKHRPKEKMRLMFRSTCLRFWSMSEAQKGFVLLPPNQTHTLDFARDAGVPSLLCFSKSHERLRPGNYEVRYVYSTLTHKSQIRELIYSLAGPDTVKQANIATLLSQLPALNWANTPVFLTIRRSKSD